MFAILFYSGNAGFQVANIVQGIKNPKHVYARIAGEIDKLFDQIVSIMPIADQVLPA